MDVETLRKGNTSCDPNCLEMQDYYHEKLTPVSKAWGSGWQLRMASFENPPTVLADYFGWPNVLRAQPEHDANVVLGRTVMLAPGKYHYLRIGIAHHPTIQNQQLGRPEIGKWKLEVQANGKNIGEYMMSTQGGLVVWEDPQFDLTPFAGQTVDLALIGHETTNDIEFYMASQTTYWSDATIVSMGDPEPWR